MQATLDFVTTAQLEHIQLQPVQLTVTRASFVMLALTAAVLALLPVQIAQLEHMQIQQDLLSATIVCQEHIQTQYRPLM